MKVTDVGMGDGGEGGVAGTPGYTAPECWEGKPADIRSDLYSVGVMAYEALTGKHPFGGRTIREVVAGQLEGWVPSPGAHRVKIPADLERVVMRALEREAPLRQGSADEFMEGFGVEDRVGVILGGELRGKDVILDRVLNVIASKDPHRASLIRMTGPPGSGKATTLRALVHELSRRGVGASTWEEWEAHRGADAQGTRLERPLQVVLLGGEGAQEQDRHEAGMRAARAVWAGAIEDGRASDLVFLATSVSGRAVADPCELVVTLDPLPVNQVSAYIEGMIGRAMIPQPLISRIHAITGGLPASLTTAIGALVARGILARRDSCWYFNETTEIRTLSIPEVASPWQSTWLRLAPPEREALLAVALAGPKVKGHVLHALGVDIRLLKPLEARGYLTAQGDDWALASEGMRLWLLDAVSGSDLEAMGRRLLDAPGVLGIEQRADMLLRLRDPAALGLAVEAAEAASARGEHYLAMKRFRECRAIAEQLNNPDLADQCALKEAEALNLVGRFAEAITLLEAGLSEARLDPQGAAKRDHLLGVSKRGVGDLTSAAVHFESARRRLDSVGNLEGSLWSLCELAEIRWRFGSLDERTSIVELLRAQLSSTNAASIPADLRAALTYHLGAALLELGDLATARADLERAATVECSAFWKMRVRIALGTAEHRAGNTAGSLRRLDEAWAECERAGVDAYRPRIMTNRGATFYQLGQFRESMSANTHGLNWARRVGNLTELLFAACGTAGCHIILGEYAAALLDADEAMKIAEVYGDPISLEKACELKAWAHYWLGDYAASVECANAAVANFGSWATTETRPRLYWVLSRLRQGEGDLLGARKRLDEALVLLRRSGDPEDLPGVEIEVLRLEGQAGNDVDRAALIQRIRGLAGPTALPTVVTLGAMAIGEILLESAQWFDSQREFLLHALASADSSEIAEASWRINFYLGALSRLQGDERNTRARFAAALKALQRIADRLDPSARIRYLDSPHVRPLLDSMSVPTR